MRDIEGMVDQLLGAQGRDVMIHAPSGVRVAAVQVALTRESPESSHRAATAQRCRAIQRHVSAHAVQLQFEPRAQRGCAGGNG